jgi:hypothetical protein
MGSPRGSKKIRFLADDPQGRWRKGEQAWEAGLDLRGAYRIHLASGRVLLLNDPYKRGLLR